MTVIAGPSKVKERTLRQGQHSGRGALCPGNIEADPKPKADVKLFFSRVELKERGDTDLN